MLELALTAWHFVASGAKAAFTWAAASTTHILIALVALLSLALLYEHHEATKCAKVLASTEAAQHTAGQAQAAAIHAPVAISSSVAEKSNAETPAYLTHADATALAHSVRCSSSSAAPSVPGTDSALPSLSGPAASPGLVCYPSVEAGQLIAAAARAAEMHQEALDLVKAGVARSE